MSKSSFKQHLTSCIEIDKCVIKKLDEIIIEVKTHHQKCNMVKTGGRIVGATGTGIVVGSLILTPFTGGLPLMIAGASTLLSIGGAGVNIATNFVDKNKSNKIISDIETILNRRVKMTSMLKNQICQIAQIIQYFISEGINEQIASQITFSGM
jgi:hypothetical protein